MQHRMKELLGVEAVREKMVMTSCKSLESARVLLFSDLQVQDIKDLAFLFTWKQWDAACDAGAEEGVRIGMVDRWCDGRFMHNGLYRIRVPELHDASERTYQNSDMDFVSMSRCMLSEGQAMYLTVDHSTYTLLRTIHPGFSVHEAQTHAALLDSSGSSVVQFECYYILNNSKHLDPIEMGMRLLIPVACKTDRVVLHYCDNPEN